MNIIWGDVMRVFWVVARWRQPLFVYLAMISNVSNVVYISLTLTWFSWQCQHTVALLGVILHERYGAFLCSVTVTNCPECCIDRVSIMSRAHETRKVTNRTLSWDDILIYGHEGMRRLFLQFATVSTFIYLLVYCSFILLFICLFIDLLYLQFWSMCRL